MTIAKRLIILVALPLVALTGLGIFIKIQTAGIETRGRFVAETQIGRLAILGNISRSFTEMRVSVRGYLLSGDQAEPDKTRSAFRAEKTKVTQLLREYSGTLVPDANDLRLLGEYRDLSGQWIAGAEKVMSLADAGRRDEALAMLRGPQAELGARIGKVSSEWIRHNEQLATDAGRAAIKSIEESRWRIFVAIGVALALSGLLGFLTFGRIVHPIRALETSVKSIAAGNYTKAIPYTHAADETGELARSIEVIKQGAAAMEEQRWIKTNAAQLTGEFQRSTSLVEFGQRFVSGIVPMLGGGVAGFYLFEKNPERLRRIVGYGLAEGGVPRDTLEPGEGLAGQCALERRSLMLCGLPPDYLRITSGLGGAAPTQAAAWPLMSRNKLRGVFEFASFREIRPNEQALLAELLPVVAMSLEILQRNLRTQELLGQTQEQARQLEKHSEELMQSQEALLRQQEDLISHQESLRASEERNRLILESAAEGIFGVDTEGRITFINRAVTRMLGFSAEELIGHVSHDIIHHHRADGKMYPLAECPMFAAYKHGKASRIDDEFLWRKDGTGLPVEYGAMPIFKDGAIVGAVTSFADITERKKSENELQKRTAELQHINFLADGALDLTKAGYWHVPLDGSPWYNSSERAVRILGDRPSPDLRYSLDDWAAHVREGNETAAKATLDNFYAALAGTIPVYDAIYAYRRPLDGRVVWIHALGHIVKDESDRPTDMHGVTQDITDFKRLEDELVAAKEAAEAATKAKSDFLANMSHEIRTPMNAIIGFSHLALKMDLSAKHRDYLSKIHNAGTSLLGVINDILDFSKIEAGKLDLETTDFSLDDVIASVTTVTGQKAHEKGLEFLVNISDAIPPTLRGDPLRLGQIITNLVNNAVKFTERGEIRVNAELLERTGDKAELRFSVRDTGQGMTKEQAARVFHPFTQADMSTTRKYGGTGLGLTICKRLVELMGGQVWLESKPDAGSTFLFTVWLGIGSPQGRGRVVPEKLQSLRVLVVDDNPAAREVLAEMLKGIADRVDVVSSGPEAVAAVKQCDGADPYEVVFMDWRMPGMDGVQATRLIKQDPQLGHRPSVIMVTAFGRDEVREEADKAQVDGFLVKPVTRSMLVDSLVTLFAPHTAETAPTAVRTDEHGGRIVGARILLTEDNEINQQIAVELLEDAGAQVQIANNGLEAVEKVAQSTYDLVLMDLQMPEMDGYQATARIRSDPRFAKLPIIAMTAHATVEERQRCLNAGMDAHISKPIDPVAMFETLGQYYHPVPRRKVEVTAPPSGSTEEVLPDLPGIDAVLGLKRVAGNRKLYVKLLRDFHRDYAPAARTIQEAIAGNRDEEARRLAHTLKGVSGSLGAMDLYAAAEEVEAALKAGNPGKAAACLPRAEERLQTVISMLAGLAETADKIPTAGPSGDVNREALGAAMKLLAEMLHKNNPEAEVALEKVMSLCRGQWTENTRQVGEAVDRFDFKGAIKALEKLAGDANVAL